MKLVAMLLMLLASLWFASRGEFHHRATAAGGVVSWTARFRVGVTPDGQHFTVRVRRPPLHLYHLHQRVRVVYDPAKTLPGSMATAGRMDTLAGMYFGPAFLMLFGLLLLVAENRMRRIGGLQCFNFVIRKSN